MAKGRKSSAAAAAAPTEDVRPYMPEPAFEPVSSGQPKLDCSDVGLDDDQELWLLQLPHDFPMGVAVEWNMSIEPTDSVRGRCTIHGQEYLLVAEQEVLSADIYATPSSPQGSLVPVARRMTVVRSTAAPLVCFGQDPAADKKAAAKRKKSQHQHHQQQQQAAAAGPSQQQQQQQQPQPDTEENKKKKKKRKAAEGEAAADEAAVAAAAAAAAAAAGGGSEKKKKEKKEKKDKSAKKEKKAKA